MSLNIDYRPDSLKQMIGNEQAIKIIQSKFGDDAEDRPHAVLLVGPAGCGKTTMGRIIARMVKALLPNETEENSKNYREMDNTDDRGLDSVRNIKKAMRYKPNGGAEARVFLMDECHQLSKDAKEGLLKPLEKPPKHVYFILCTTEPEKLKETFRRRCLTIELQRFSEEETVKLLKRIVKKKRKKVKESVLEKIHENSLGSPGMSLKLLEAIIDLSPKEMKIKLESEARKASATIDLCRALMRKEPWKKVAKILQGLRQESIENVRRGVLGYCTNTILKKDEPVAYSIMDAFREPFFSSPFEQLVLASYECLYADED